MVLTAFAKISVWSNGTLSAFFKLDSKLTKAAAVNLVLNFIGSPDAAGNTPQTMFMFLNNPEAPPAPPAMNIGLTGTPCSNIFSFIFDLCSGFNLKNFLVAKPKPFAIPNKPKAPAFHIKAVLALSIA